MSRHFFRALPLVLPLLCPVTVRANTPEDILGLGARARGLGGAGTAATDDFSSVYYNPSSLASCPNRSFTVDISHTAYALTMDAQPGDPALEELRDQTRVYIGFCTELPYGLAFGMALGTGLQNPMTLDQTTLDPEPQYLFYGEPLEQLSIMVGLAWRIFDELSIGVGAAILVNSLLTVDATVPVIDDDEVAARLHWELKPTNAGYVGVRYQPIEQLQLAATYRSALFHDLDARAPVEVEVASVPLTVDLLLESAAWYSPQQVALGGAVNVVPELTITADVTWYDWSAHPGPFVVASPGGDATSVAAALRYAPREDYGFHDVWVPRIGVEYRFEDIGVAVRGGFAHRPSPAPLPRRRSNLLDAGTNTVAVGGGYRFGATRGRPHGSAFGPMAGERGGDALAAGSDEGGINGRVDAYLRLHAMGSHRVVRTGGDVQEVLNDYEFGGNVFDLGVALTVGWF